MSHCGTLISSHVVAGKNIANVCSYLDKLQKDLFIWKTRMTTNMHTLASDRIPLLIPILHSGTTNYTETQQINRDHVAEDERINELTTTTAKKKR